MPRINVELPDNVTQGEATQIENWLKGISRSEWEIFKENFEAFKRSFIDVCKAFWHKFVGWLRDVWNRWFG